MLILISLRGSGRGFRCLTDIATRQDSRSNDAVHITDPRKMMSPHFVVRVDFRVGSEPPGARLEVTVPAVRPAIPRGLARTLSGQPIGSS